MIGDSPGKLESLIADISAFERAECLDRWREVFGRPPPKYLSPQFMTRVLIWETQNEALGGVSVQITRRLNQIASGKTLPATTKPGSHLIREWNGVTHVVDVVEGGFLWSGQRYRSLSPIARAITGTRWNGSLFFGLRNRRST